MIFPPQVIVTLILLIVPSFLRANTNGNTVYDPYGGWKQMQGAKTGFFHTQRINGKWWIVSPDGDVFFSKGINSVHPPHAQSFQGTGAREAAGLLKSWGMNTAGCWSDPNLIGEGVPLAYRCKIDRTPEREFPDVFDPSWKKEVEQQAEVLCTPFRDNPWLLGYFIDNERPWKHDDQAAEFVSLFLGMQPSSPGYLEASKAKEGGVEAMKVFREKVAELYFKTTADAIHHADPNHMILGCRFAGRPPLGVVAKMKGCSDIISINNYQERPSFVFS